MAEPVEPVTNCPECGEPLVNVRGHAVCPSGKHGKLYPKVKNAPGNRAELRRAAREKLLASLPAAEKCGGLQFDGITLYRIAGHGGYWKRVGSFVGKSRAVLRGQVTWFYQVTPDESAAKWLKE